MATNNDLANANTGAWYAKNEKTMLLILAMAIIILSFAYWTLITIYPIKPENAPLAHMIGGGLFTLATIIIGYYWGSSNGSAKKSEQMERMAQTQDDKDDDDTDDVATVYAKYVADEKTKGNLTPMSFADWKKNN